MSLRAIGPVVLDYGDHGDPDFSWDSSPTASGIRGATIAGKLIWGQALYLSELCANPELVQTIGTATGVLARIEFDDELLWANTGWYLLSNFKLSAGHRDSLGGLDGYVPFSLAASFLGAQVEPVVISTSHQIETEFGTVGTPWAANPFADEVTDGTGSWLVIDVDGTEVLREYDPTDTVSMGDNSEVLVP